MSRRHQPTNREANRCRANQQQPSPPHPLLLIPRPRSRPAEPGTSPHLLPRCSVPSPPGTPPFSLCTNLQPLPSLPLSPPLPHLRSTEAVREEKSNAAPVDASEAAAAECWGAAAAPGWWRGTGIMPGKGAAPAGGAAMPAGKAMPGCPEEKSGAIPPYGR